MDKNDELRLRASVKELELSYQVTSMAIKIGWLPFVAMAWIVNKFAETMLVFAFDLNPTYLVIVCFVVLIFSLIVFYAFVFKRSLKLGAELSLKRAQLEMESKYNE
ncbi:hypothetical protein [Photobacterium sp. 1_MG-2023]|uniref:hypothetical protein n=1 Tax=Photobacterium sp. 1_MG-2023 TaxID=3062646 RepID=UPI0026E26C4D|nr:hypothetical protein [Photobacterium sp. 1_MG-2023]MDO6706773.1 hypothetical protein [Photobacterium sp. 1_MG-2023]